MYKLAKALLVNTSLGSCETQFERHVAKTLNLYLMPTFTFDFSEVVRILVFKSPFVYIIHSSMGHFYHLPYQRENIPALEPRLLYKITELFPDLLLSI